MTSQIFAHLHVYAEMHMIIPTMILIEYLCVQLYKRIYNTYIRICQYLQNLMYSHI